MMILEDMILTTNKIDELIGLATTQKEMIIAIKDTLMDYQTELDKQLAKLLDTCTLCGASPMTTNCNNGGCDV